MKTNRTRLDSSAGRCTRRAALGTLLGAGLWLAGGCRPTEEKQRGLLRFGYVLGGTRLNQPPGVIGWGFVQGIIPRALAEIGLDRVEFVAAGGPAFNQIFAAGAVDVFTTGDSPGVIGRAAGLDMRLINVDMLEYNLYLVTRPDGPRTVRELAGRKIACGPVSNTWRYVHGLLEQEGLGGRVELVNIPAGESEAALRRGEVDAISASFGPIHAERGLRVLDEARSHPGLAGSLITVGGSDFLGRHPDFAGVWNDAVARSLLDARQNVDAFYAFLKETSPLPEWALRELYPLNLWSADPLPPRGREVMELTKRFLLEQRAIRADFTIAEWIAPAIHRGLAQPA